MFSYLRSKCDLGCKTVWSAVLLCIKKDLCGSFYKELPRSDIIYMHATSFVMLLKSLDPNVLIFAQNTQFSHKTWLWLELWWYTHIQACDILSLLILSCPHDTDSLEPKHSLVRIPLTVFPVGLEPTTLLDWNLVYCLIRHRKSLYGELYLVFILFKIYVYIWLIFMLFMR